MKMKTLPPATMIMTFHREEHYAHKSLLGMERVRAYCKKNQQEVFLICTLDCSNESTTKIVKNFIHQNGYKDDQIIEIQYGSLAASRNVGIDHAKTEYVGFLDGDDFISSNWLYEATQKQLSNRHQLLCFPEYILSFGQKIEYMESLSSKKVPFIVAAQNNFWASSSFGHISTYELCPYNERIDKNVNFCFEDWDFNLRCLSKGIMLEPVLNTYLFYRRRGNSMLTQHVQKNLFTPPSDFWNNIIL